MGPYKGVAQGRLVLLAALMAGVLISGCAQPQNTTKHAANQQQDLRTRTAVRLDYFSDDGGCVLVAVANNPRRDIIRLWLSQSFSTDGQRTSSEQRYYVGQEEVIKQMFRLDCAAVGVTHSMRVDAYNAQGEKIFTTKEITVEGEGRK